MLRWVHFESYYTKQRKTVNELQVYVLANKEKTGHQTVNKSRRNCLYYAVIFCNKNHC